MNHFRAELVHNVGRVSFGAKLVLGRVDQTPLRSVHGRRNLLLDKQDACQRIVSYICLKQYAVYLSWLL